MTTDDVVVRTVGLGKRYGDHQALDDVDLVVPAGGVHGLVGPNGAGKTTLLSIVLGLRRPTSGHVDHALARHQIAAVPDTPASEPWLTAYETVDLARYLTDPDLPPERVEEVLAQTGLTDAANRRVGGFSRGMLQRLGLATALVGHPRLLVLDEPASALDPAGRRDVLDLVREVGAQATVLFSSHILGDVQQVCDTVGILRAGRLLFQGPLEQLLVGRAAPAMRIVVRDGARTLGERLRHEPWTTHVEVSGDEQVVVIGTGLGVVERRLVPVLADTAVSVVSITPQHGDLEQVFLELTS